MTKDMPADRHPPSESRIPQAGDCALLQVVNATRSGAFMAWKPGRDLLIPVSQQLKPMKSGQSHVVYLFRDPDNRTIGSTKLHRHLLEEADGLDVGDEVKLMIVGKSRLGYKAVINGTHLGLLFANEVFQPLKAGDELPGYIKSIREDRRVNLSLQPVHKSRSTLESLADQILSDLRENHGESDLTDASPPDAIYRRYRVSKGNYKKALGLLKRKNRVELSREKVRLVGSAED